MAGTFVIDVPNTFATVIFMSCVPKADYKTGVVETDRNNVPKWTVEAAVTFHPMPGMRPTSEVITITIASPNDPGQGTMPGQPVQIDGMRVGISAPERNDKGGIRGGRPWYQASGLRPAAPAARPAREDKAA